MFSVVVPTFDRRGVLLASLAALAEVHAPWPCEVIVVVDGSTDGTAEAVRGLSVTLPVRVLEQPNAGAAAARNRGAAAARGRYLLFLDDDMAADRQLLVAHERLLAAGADAVVGHIPLHPDSPRTVLSQGVDQWSRRRHARLAASGGELTLPDLLTGQLSVRADLFARTGGFDTRFTSGGTFGGEDTDFLHRLVSDGADVRFAADAISWQRYVVTPRQYLRQWRDAGRADAALARKHPGLGRQLLRQHGGNGVQGRLIRAALPALSGGPARRAAAFVVPRAEAGRTDVATAWAFRTLRDVQYWAGVRDNGGLAPAPRAVRILAYHAIEDVSDPLLRDYAVPPELFERQLAALTAAGFRFVGPGEALEHLRGAPAPHPSVLLTFDDGYRSVLENAAPVLRRLGIPGVAFVVASQIGRWNEWDARTGAAKLNLMDAADLAGLAAEGWTIGNHTRTHAHLGRLDPAALTEEVVRSQQDLTAAGLAPARLLAYPYGEHDARVRAATRAAGYEAAFALAGRRRDVRGADPFAVPRIEVQRHHEPRDLVRLVLDPPQARGADLNREVRGWARAVLGAGARG